MRRRYLVAGGRFHEIPMNPPAPSWRALITAACAVALYALQEFALWVAGPRR